MGLRNVMKGAVIASMMLSLPAYSAAAASVRASQSVPSTVVSAPVSGVRAGAELQNESELRRGGFVIPLLALGAVILGLLVLLQDDDDPVVSP